MYDWELDQDCRIVVIQLSTGLRLPLNKQLDEAVRQALRALQSVCLERGGDIFRDIEYRAARDIFLARAWELGTKEAGQ